MFLRLLPPLPIATPILSGGTKNSSVTVPHVFELLFPELEFEFESPFFLFFLLLLFPFGASFP